MTSITSATSATSGSAPTSPTNPSTNISQDQFLQLMVDQLQYQDPLSPTDTTDYLSELANFTGLEQQTNTAQATANSETLSMLGHTVTYNAKDGSAQSGQVTAVDLTGTTPTLTVGTASGIDLTAITSVS